MSQPIPPLAADWNNFFNLIVYTALIALAVVVSAMVLFAVIFRERKGQHPKFHPRLSSSQVTRGRIVFASFSVILLFGFAFLSYTVVPNSRFASGDSLNIDVSAFQWGWLFTYPNGGKSTNTLKVPENTTVMFNVTSLDVMHNFYLVDFHVSIDAIPGRYNILYVTMPSLNDDSQLNYTIRCKELCGIGHAYMVASLDVLNASAYDQWLSSHSSSSSANGGG